MSLVTRFSLSNRGSSNSGGSSSGSSNPECPVARGWRGLYGILSLLGTSLGWCLAPHLTADTNREMMLQRVQGLMKGLLSSNGQEGDEQIMEVLYVTITLFLHSLLEYSTNVAKDNPAGSSVGLTLVEAFTAPQPVGGSSRSSSVCSDDLDVLSPPRPKRHRTSQDNDALVPYISVGQGEGVCGAGLSQALSTGIKCWDLLHSHPKLRSEFSSLIDRLCLGSSLRLFTTDMLLHDARLTEASRDLRHMLSQQQRLEKEGSMEVDTSPSFSNLELCLKLASVNYALNNFSGAAEAALEVVQLLPPPSNSAPPHTVSLSSAAPGLTISSGIERHLHLLPLSRMHCLQFVVTLLINALRTRVITHKFHDDLSIGHLLTLVQYDWPKHEAIFNEIVSVLMKQGGLSYEQFALYVTVPDIVEEFVFLHGRDGGALHLDIVPPAPHVKQQRTVSTRMADRGSKHDFKEAMRKQILRCEESVPQNLISFLNTEGASIRQNLM